MPVRSGSRKRSAKPAPVSMKQVADRAREMIRSEWPTLKVEQHWGHPWFVGKGMVCVVGYFARHAAIEFWWGSTIEDPDHLLEGTGKNLRHVKLRTLAEASSPQLRRFVRAAVELDRTAPRRTR
jgi:hypothetical protein